VEPERLSRALTTKSPLSANLVRRPGRRLLLIDPQAVGEQVGIRDEDDVDGAVDLVRPGAGGGVGWAFSAGGGAPLGKALGLRRPGEPRAQLFVARGKELEHVLGSGCMLMTSEGISMDSAVVLRSGVRVAWALQSPAHPRGRDCRPTRLGPDRPTGADVDHGELAELAGDGIVLGHLRLLEAQPRDELHKLGAAVGPGMRTSRPRLLSVRSCRGPLPHPASSSFSKWLARSEGWPCCCSWFSQSGSTKARSLPPSSRTDRWRRAWRRPTSGVDDHHHVDVVGDDLERGAQRLDLELFAGLFDHLPGGRALGLARLLAKVKPPWSWSEEIRPTTLRLG